MLSCVVCHFGYSTIYDQDYEFLNNNNLRFYLKNHAVNHIIRVYKNYKLRKNLYKYSILLLDQYYNPKSKYIQYIINNFDNNNENNKKMAYINKYNKLIFFNFII